jgi:hypothetical protein
MKAWVIVELRDLVQAELHVVPRPDPFAGVYRPRSQSRDDLSSPQDHHDGAEPAQHLTAQARHPVFQSDVAFGAGHLLRKPAAHLHAGVQTQQRFDVVVGT